MADISNAQKNYEEIFITIIEYIKDNPSCIKQKCTRDIFDRFDIKTNEASSFITTTISKVSIEYRGGTGDQVLIIHPDALFYLMEYRELKHSLEESKQARKQATLSTWFAVAGIAISIIGLAVSIYYSNKQIELSEKQIMGVSTEAKK